MLLSRRCDTRAITRQARSIANKRERRGAICFSLFSTSKNQNKKRILRAFQNHILSPLPHLGLPRARLHRRRRHSIDAAVAWRRTCAARAEASAGRCQYSFRRLETSSTFRRRWVCSSSVAQWASRAERAGRTARRLRPRRACGRRAGQPPPSPRRRVSKNKKRETGASRRRVFLETFFSSLLWRNSSLTPFHFFFPTLSSTRNESENKRKATRFSSLSFSLEFAHCSCYSSRRSAAGNQDGAEEEQGRKRRKAPAVLSPFRSRLSATLRILKKAK